MNSKSIVYFTLFFLLFFPLITKSVQCNDESSKACVDVIVKSHDGSLLQNMVVYIEPLAGQTLPKTTKKIVIGQQNKSFTPYISVSQSKSTINFLNQDDITHHIYSVGSDNDFSFKIRAGQTHTSTRFEQAAEVAMGCNIHDWMSGYLLLVDTPYFGKTNKQGQVSFTLAEQGKYKVVVWHPQMQVENNRMVIEKDILVTETLSFTLLEQMGDIPIQESDDDFDFISDY